MTAPRAVRDFTVRGDPWPVVDRWAQHQGYHVLRQEGDHRVYKKGTGFMTGARMLDIAKSGEDVHVEAWVTASGGARAMSLFILPKEMTIEPGGAKGVLPRKLGREEVNELMQGLGQPAITGGSAASSSAASTSQISAAAATAAPSPPDPAKGVPPQNLGREEVNKPVQGLGQPASAGGSTVSSTTPGSGAATSSSRISDAAAVAAPSPPDPKVARWLTWIGGIIFIVSALVSFISYSNAKEEAESGSSSEYTVLVGPMIGGLVLLGVGIGQRASQKKTYERALGTYNAAEGERSVVRRRAQEGELEAEWYPDPTGQKRLRYYDGKEWTEHVAD